MWSTLFRHKEKKHAGSTPKGKLFGHPLADVCPENKIPKQIMVSGHADLFMTEILKCICL